MLVRILENRGIHIEGAEVEMARAQGEQWILSGFAEYVPPVVKAKPKAEPKAEVKAEPEVKAKPKAKKAKKEEGDNSS